MADSLWPHGVQPTRLLGPWDFPGESTGVGCHCLLWKRSFWYPTKSISESVYWLAGYNYFAKIQWERIMISVFWIYFKRFSLKGYNKKMLKGNNDLNTVDNLWAETNKWMSQKILWWNLSIFLPLSVSHPSVPSSFPSSFFPFSLSPHHLPFLPLLFPFPSLSPSLSSLFKKAM